MPGWGLAPWGSGSWGLGGDPPLNLGYEIAGSGPGIPEGWSIVVLPTAFQHAEFSGYGAEAFDWGGVLVTTAGNPLAFSTSSVETFDSWVPGGLIQAPPLIGIQFLGGDVAEDFEELWAGNQFFKTDFVGVGTDLTAVLFDTGSQDSEDFETGWGNDAFLTDFVGIGTDLTAVLFDLGLQSVEDFEEVREDLEFLILDPTNDILELVAVHGLGPSDPVFFVNRNGVLPSPLLEDPTPYYVHSAVSGSAIKVKHSTAVVPPIDILDYGTGSHALRYDPGEFWITVMSSF